MKLKLAAAQLEDGTSTPLPPPISTALQWEMAGGAGAQGSLESRVPPELLEREVVHRLLGENHQLQEALKRGNVALKERCQEMEEWKQRSTEEREFFGRRFQEARDLVEKLVKENRKLLGQLDQAGDDTPGRGREQETLCGTSEEKAKARQGEAEEEDVKLVSPQSLPIEGGNEVLRLLRSHKEQVKVGMRELKRRNKELEQEVEEGLRERERLLAANAELLSTLSETQGFAVEEEAIQAAVSHILPGGVDSGHRAQLELLARQLQAAQLSELQEVRLSQQKTTAQNDGNQTHQKEMESECSQVFTKDTEVLKAQVTSLLGELQERQSSLQRSEEERALLNKSLCEVKEALQNLERETEEVKTQHSVTADKLRLQTQNLETALKAERLVLKEDRRKLALLQRAYTQLYQDYDLKLKIETQAKQREAEVEDLSHRLMEAERALALKQGLIDKLKNEVEQQKGALETLPVLTAQAEIYKQDFQAEREAREKLHQLKEELQEQLDRALAEIDKLRLQSASRARMREMQQRHMADFRADRNLGPPLAGGFQGATVPFSLAQSESLGVFEELPEHCCPKCHYQAPDLDTLQVHLSDCIQ